MAGRNQGRRRSSRGGIAVSLFNILTAMMVFATVLFLLVIVVVVFVPDMVPAGILPEFLQPEEILPTSTRLAEASVPTVTPSYTPGVTLPPTRTPVPAQPTNTPPPTNTRRPTLTPSITPSLPPATPTRTPTPTPTDTPTPGPSPTVTNTRSPFPFTKSLDSPTYLQNFANNAGCNWLGIAGEVFDLEGNPVATGAYRVHIWDNGIDVRVTPGEASAYGPSGYEQFLFDSPRIQDHNIQLETANGTAVSQVYRVTTRSSCNQNLLYFIFVQNN